MTKHTRKLRAEQLEKRELLAADTGFLQETELPSTSEFVEVASLDGTDNNLLYTDWGSTDSQLLRLVSVEYADGVWLPSGEDRASARVISNAVSAQSVSVESTRYLTDLTWLWGQFIDHDLDLTASGVEESFDIAVPTGDEYFDPYETGTATIGLARSVYDPDTGHEEEDPRQQINLITAFLDGSVVYGSDQERADALRTFVGGRLKTSDGDLLPFNVEGLDNAGGPSDTLFLAGDVRANENAALTAMHTLWVREHNRLADEIASQYPEFSDEQIYQQARAIVRAEIQAITFNEFLPALLGKDAIAPYEGYNPDINPGISNLFSTAAYRFGHSMLSSELLRLNVDGTVVEEGNLALRDAFFAPQQIVDGGIDSLLFGAANQLAQEIDTLVIDDVRNFLFGQPGQGGFDLAALNIQRGRDHGLADYNQARIDLGLQPVTSFDQITSNTALVLELERLYGHIDNIDAWVGGLAEDHLPDSSVGEFIHTVLVDQFQRLRDGDRFWYQNLYSGRKLADLERTTLADVIGRNTDIEGLSGNVFVDRPDSKHAHPELGRPPRRRIGPFLPMVEPQTNRPLPPATFVEQSEKRSTEAPLSDQQQPLSESPSNQSPEDQRNRRRPRASEIPDATNVPDAGLAANELAALDTAISRMHFGRHRR